MTKVVGPKRAVPIKSKSYGSGLYVDSTEENEVILLYINPNKYFISSILGFQLV